MEEEETRRQGVPLGRRFHALYDNKWWKILWQVWKIQTWLKTYEKYDMKGIQYPQIDWILDLEETIKIGEIIGAWRGRQVSWELLKH